MRFGISLPQGVADGSFDPEAFRAYVSRADALGLESAWTMLALPLTLCRRV
jgi:hypothetical protein